MTLSLATRGILVALASLIAACGGGGLTAGISGTGITSEGTVTAFGSIIVNGVTFETDDARIIVNGDAATEDALSVGQVVTVRGTLETETRGVAKTVTFNRALDGPIGSIDQENGVITALSQTVRLNETTVFIDVTRAGLAENNLIAVSGFRNGSGEIVATAVQLGSRNFTFGTLTDLEGTATNLTATTFNLGGLVVDYRNASPDETAGLLRNGAQVEVFGTQETERGVFTATSVEVLNPIRGAPGRRVELEGIVVNFSGRGNFTVSGQPVNSLQASQTGNSLSNGDRIEVEGVIDDNGVLVAEEILVRAPGGIGLTGTVSAVNVKTGTVTLLGAPITVTPVVTRFRDLSAMGERRLGLDDLRSGDYVEVRAVQSADGRLVATGIEHHDMGILADVSGPLDICRQDWNMLVIGGVTVRADVTTAIMGRHGAQTDLAGLCSTIAHGDALTATGAGAGDEIFATEIRLVD